MALVARGKTDWEISQILGIGQETVIQHMKDARDRYGVTKRTLLAIRALFEGQISFADPYWRIDRDSCVGDPRRLCAQATQKNVDAYRPSQSLIDHRS